MAAVFLSVFTHIAAGQTLVPLFGFGKEWRYETSGSDLGTAWRTNDFDAAAWPTGPGLLQTGETTAYPAPFLTTLPLMDGRITYYFRTRFDMPPAALAAGWQLFATNLVDDGCVIYVNGVEAGRVRMPTGQNHLTLANGGPSSEGQFDVIDVTTLAVRAGENVIAVEVHQMTATSGDLVWGMSLAAAIPQPVAIITPPASGAYLIGETVTLAVTAEGSPRFYQWQKDGQDIAGANSATYSFVAAAESQTGVYTVVITNRANRVVSTGANVLVFADRFGPVISSAVAQGIVATNRIDLSFSEFLDASTIVPGNFRVVRISDGQEVTISNAVTSAATVRLIVGGPHWRLFDDYFVVVSKVKDRKGNSIAPGSRVPVGWRIQNAIFGTGQEWTFHSAAIFDPDVYDQPWTEIGYFPGSWWATAPGHFYHLRCQDPMATDVGYQPEPVLFRTSFNWPATNPPRADLQIALAVDDGAILYLNGLEILRNNAPAGRPTSTSRALVASTFGCLPATNTVSVTNLVPGANVLAVAVLQEASVTSSDGLFVLALSSFHLQTPRLPDEPPPVLEITQVSSNLVRLAWPGGGFTLESTTEFTNSLSYPVGPWRAVTNMANPMLYPLDTPFRFFRLRTP